MSLAPSSSELVEHFFRHEYGRLVAALARRFGLQHLEVIEDSVQASLASALTAWTANGTPREPGAWLFQVALRNVLAMLRSTRRHAALDSSVSVVAPVEPLPTTFESEVSDDLLRMLFVCCHEEIAPESRLVFALKTLCGFSTSEIAARLMTSEANVQKRLQRARTRLRDLPSTFEEQSVESLRDRLPSVQGVIYVLFNEGYLSVTAEHAIRAELCAEAIRLATVLVAHAVGAVPSTFALLALMHLHSARLGARQDATGALLLLEEQDRASWDPQHLQRGATWLAQAAQGETVTRFHAEAGIAAEHCFAPSFAETNWASIASLYATLERIDPSPLHTVSRAVAVAQLEGPAVGLAMLEALVPPAWLERHFVWDAVRADLALRAGKVELGQLHRARALASAPSDAIRAALERRLSGSAEH